MLCIWNEYGVVGQLYLKRKKMNALNACILKIYQDDLGDPHSCTFKFCKANTRVL